MIRASKQHLQDNHEGYFQHQRFALRYALACFSAGFMALLHGLIPACYPTKASDTIKALASRKRDE